MAVLFVSLGVALGQTVQGVITGAVSDPSGAVIPKATVTITNEGTGISQTDTTGTDGLYRFPLVPLGTYTVKVSYDTVAALGIPAATALALFAYSQSPLVG
jgi:hypothetical protein